MWHPYQKSGSRRLTLREPLWLSWLETFHIHCNMYFQHRNRVGHGHCGLIVYVHETFLSKEIVIENANTSWDYLCVQLSHNSPNSRKYILCNVYRLLCYLAADIDLFNAEFCSLLRTIKHRTPLF